MTARPVGALALAYLSEVEGGPFPQSAIVAPALADLRALLAALEASRADAARLGNVMAEILPHFAHEAGTVHEWCWYEEATESLSAHRALTGGAL